MEQKTIALPSRFRLMMALFTQHDLQGRRHAWAYQFSNGRTESSKELTGPEVDAIIKSIEENFKTDDKANRMRKKILAFAHNMRWELAGNKIDMKRVNDYCCTYGYLKKPLNYYKPKELPLLVSQFEKAHDHFIKNI